MVYIYQHHLVNNKLLIVTDDQIINETNVYNENISAINVFTLAL